MHPGRAATRTGAIPPGSGSALPQRGRRRGWRGGGRGTGIGQLQRLERIDQAGAEIVVTVARSEPPRAGGQDAADVGRRQLRIALEQQRHNAYLGGRQPPPSNNRLSLAAETTCQVLAL